MWVNESYANRTRKPTSKCDGEREGKLYDNQKIKLPIYTMQAFDSFQTRYEITLWGKIRYGGA